MSYLGIVPVITSFYKKNILESQSNSPMALDVYSASLLQTLLCCCLNLLCKVEVVSYLAEFHSRKILLSNMGLAY